MTYRTAVRTQSAAGMDWTQGFHSPEVAERVAEAHRQAGFTVTVEPIGPDADTAHPTDTATLAEIRLARAAGRHAFFADRPDAPGADKTIRDLIGDRPVGQPRTLVLMAAFSAEYDHLRDETARALLAETA